MQTTDTFPLHDAFRVACAIDNVSMSKKARDFGIAQATLMYVLKGKTTSEPVTTKVMDYIRQVDETLFDRYGIKVEPQEA